MTIAKGIPQGAVAGQPGSTFLNAVHSIFHCIENRDPHHRERRQVRAGGYPGCGTARGRATCRSSDRNGLWSCCRCFQSSSHRIYLHNQRQTFDQPAHCPCGRQAHAIGMRPGVAGYRREIFTSLLAGTADACATQIEPHFGSHHRWTGFGGSQVAGTSIHAGGH